MTKNVYRFIWLLSIFIVIDLYSVQMQWSTPLWWVPLLQMLPLCSTWLPTQVVLWENSSETMENMPWSSMMTCPNRYAMSWKTLNTNTWCLFFSFFMINLFIADGLFCGIWSSGYFYHDITCMLSSTSINSPEEHLKRVEGFVFLA